MGPISQVSYYVLGYMKCVGFLFFGWTNLIHQIKIHGIFISINKMYFDFTSQLHSKFNLLFIFFILLACGLRN